MQTHELVYIPRRQKEKDAKEETMHCCIIECRYDGANHIIKYTMKEYCMEHIYVLYQPCSSKEAFYQVTAQLEQSEYFVCTYGVGSRRITSLSTSSIGRCLIQ